MYIEAALYSLPPATLPSAFVVSQCDVVQDGRHHVFIRLSTDLVYAIVGKRHVKIVVRLGQNEIGCVVVPEYAEGGECPSCVQEVAAEPHRND